MLSRFFDGQAALRIGRALRLGDVQRVEFAEGEGGHTLVAHAERAYAVLRILRKNNERTIQYWTYDRDGQEVVLREYVCTQKQTKGNGEGKCTMAFVHYAGWDEEQDIFTGGTRSVVLNDPSKARGRLVSMISSVEKQVGIRLI